MTLEDSTVEGSTGEGVQTLQAEGSKGAGVQADESPTERSARMSALAKRSWEVRRKRASEAVDGAGGAGSDLVASVLDGTVEAATLDASDAALVLKTMRQIVASRKAPEAARVQAGNVLLKYAEGAGGADHAPDAHAQWRTTLSSLPPHERLAFLREVQGLGVQSVQAVADGADGAGVQGTTA